MIPMQIVCKNLPKSVFLLRNVYMNELIVVGFLLQQIIHY